MIDPLLPKPGNVQNCLTQWEWLTSNPVILSYVQGYEIEFDELPVQTCISNEYRQNAQQKSVLQIQIDELVNRGVVDQVQFDESMYVSNVFGRPKPNGEIRMIIDLSEVNNFVQKFHFKMEHLDVALDLLDEGMFLSSIDLKDAYYSIPIFSEHKQYLTFQWEKQYFQFNVLPFGLTSAPRVFTKILKPIFAIMREEGFCVIGYIDDSLIMADSYEECEAATNRLSNLFQELGFSINRQKSVMTPSQTITFLGYVVNSRHMTVSPTQKKVSKALDIVNKLLRGKNFKIRFVASAIGFIVDLCKGVEYGANHYRFLERDKILALRRVGDMSYEGNMYLSSEAKQELMWWKHNVRFRSKKIRLGSPKFVLTTDASNEGWGAVFKGESTGGRWSESEKDQHINALELNAILLGLQSFFRDDHDIEILIRTDNTTALSYVNHMGGSRSIQCEDLAKEIWEFCEIREIWIIATYIPGNENEEADFMSRNFTDNTEWSLNQHIFDKICDTWGTPQVDLFASRLNHKLCNYVSWVKDPCALYSDAFTVDWDEWDLIYLFPPFSLVSKCLRRIRRTSATVILVVPEWSGQPWFAQLHRPLVKDMLRFPTREGNLVPPSDHLSQFMINKVPLRVLLC